MAKPRTITTVGGSWGMTFSKQDLRKIDVTKGDRVGYVVDEDSGEIRVFPATVAKRD